MKNELFSIGPFTVYGYGLMIAIGVIAAYITGEYRAKKQKLDADSVLSLVLWCVAGGLLGAKILYIITQMKEIIANPKILLNVADGFVVYGGISGGIIAAIIYCKIKKLVFLQYFDLLMPSVALAQGFGRIGCFLAGCCYGQETDSAFCIVFHDSAFAPNGVGLVPTQLISSGLNFLHFFVLIWFAKHKKGEGQVAGLYLVCYSVGRFILEYFRGDLIRGAVGTFSTSQFISIFIFTAGIVLMIARNGKMTEVPASKEEE
ncbi:MAG: prolipoprotein diacylglyceryl transferase [Clostridia bacterium]|nr:prolipoprotein diacylglyceryl transferase [Clostridia bacterium]